MQIPNPTPRFKEKYAIFKAETIHTITRDTIVFEHSLKSDTFEILFFTYTYLLTLLILKINKITQTSHTVWRVEQGCVYR